jgi:NADH-quinone oxidoreductase subunit C
MTAEEIQRKLRERCGDAVLELDTSSHDAWIGVDPERIDAVAAACKHDGDLGFDSLMCLSGVDDRENIKVVYHLHSLRMRHRIVLKTTVPKPAPVTRTVIGVWRAAGWFERECWDLLGVRFEGHPDLRRILLPDDWEGHPLRKEYVFPTEYRGLDNTRDYSV